MGSTTMALMNVCAKYIYTETEINYLQIGVFRGFCMTIGTYTHARCLKLNVFDIPRGYGFLVFCRAFFGFSSSLGQFAAIFYCPLSIAIVLYFT